MKYKAKALLVEKFESGKAFNAGLICCECAKTIPQSRDIPDGSGRVVIYNNDDLMEEYQLGDAPCGMGCEKDLRGK